MAFKLFADAYEHTPQPEVIIDKRSIMDEDGTKPVGIHHAWRINGTLIADGSAAIQVLINGLEAAYVSPSKLQLKEGAVVTYELDGTSALCREGLVVTMPPSFPVGAGQGQYATQRKYSIVVEASFYDGGEKGDPEILWLEERTIYAVDQHGKTTRSIRGRLRTKDGVSAEGKFATVTPSIPAGYNRMSYSHEINDDDDEMSYNFVDLEYWSAWPTSVTGGESTQTTRLDENGQLRLVRAGSFNGSGAQAAADALKLGGPQYKVAMETQTVNPYSGSVSFHYEYIDTVGSETDYLSYLETVSVTWALQDFVMHTVLGGGAAVKQNTVVRPASATQTGNAVGHSAFPTAPAELWTAADIKTKSQSKSGPVRGPDGSYSKYGLTWSYTFEFDTTPTFHDPNTS